MPPGYARGEGLSMPGFLGVPHGQLCGKGLLRRHRLTGLSGRRCGSRFSEESFGLLPRGEAHVVCHVRTIDAPLALAPGCKNPNGLTRQRHAARKA